MDIVNLCFYAEGYYSGSTYEENITVSKEFYEKIKDKVEEMEVCVYELDGKHSTTYGNIEVQSCKEADIIDWWEETENDGSFFYSELSWICQCYFNLDLDKEIKEVEEYIDSLDTYVEIEVRVKKSQMDKLVEFMHKLDNESK